MSENGPVRNKTLPLEALERVDRTCMEFEAAWRSGQPPRLEDFLGGVQGAERAKLFRELLLLELDYRRGEADPLTLRDYETRFPGDKELVADVLRTHQPTGVSRQTRQSQGTVKARTPAREVGTRTSEGRRFRILRRHAKGGLGEVLVAHDQELDREVALKEMRTRYAGHAQSCARFMLEAQITGSLEHPGIVPVYGLGTYPDGRPFYAMRFVRGDSLQEAIQRFHNRDRAATPAARSIEFRKLLGRFIDVCHAIEYAHSQGVLHRDLKPANIMLGKYGETLVVDWGLAKVFGDGDIRATPGSPVSPITSERVATVTEAGAVVGTPPFMSPEQAAGQLHLLGPCSDVYGLGATLYTLLAGFPPFSEDDTGDVLRKVKAGDFKPPRGAQPKTPRALEAVCLRAMALKPDDRYFSPTQLADDIEAWLADEHVSAYRESPLRRSRRWIRHHQTSVMSTAVAVIVAIACLCVGIILLAAKNRELQTANDGEKAAKAQAERRFEIAMDAIETYYTGVSEDALLKQRHVRDLREMLLKAPLEYYDRIRQDLEGDTSTASRVALAKAYDSIARITQQVGSKEDAAKSSLKAIEIREELVGKGLVPKNCQRNLARSYIDAGRIHGDLGLLEKAHAAYVKAVEIRENLARKNPSVAEIKHEQAMCYNDFGILLRNMGEPEMALKYYRQAMTIHEELAAADQTCTEYQDCLAKHYSNVAVVHIAHLNEPDHALEYLKKAVNIREQLADEDATNPGRQNSLATLYDKIGNVHRKMGDADQALTNYRKAVRMHETLAARYANFAEYQSRVANDFDHLSILHRDMGHLEEAFHCSKKAVDIATNLVASNPAASEFAVLKGGICCNTGNLTLSAGEPEQAFTWYSEAVQLLQGVIERDERHWTARQSLRNSHLGRARALNRLARYEEAVTDWDRVIALDPQVVNLVWMERARAQAMSGDYVTATDVAAQMATGQEDPGETQYHAACIFSLASAAVDIDQTRSVNERQQMANQYAHKAITFLGNARQLGFFKSAERTRRLKSDSDLDPIRMRDEFQAMIEELPVAADEHG